MSAAIGTFTMPFMQHALIALLALSLVAAVVGVALNLRGLEFVSDGLVHAVFPGVVIGFVTAGVEGIYLGAAIAALLATAVLTWAARRGAGTDATTAVLLAGTFAIGIVIVSRTTTFSTGLEHLLFGQLLTVRPADLIAIGVLGAIALVTVVLTWKEQLFLSFDRRGARAAGYGTLAYELALNISIALVVVAGARAVGNLLVLAVLIVPAAIGRLLVRRIGAVVAIALATAVVTSVVGLWLAFHLSISLDVQASPSAVVVLVLIALYLAAACWARLAGHRRASRGDRIRRMQGSREAITGAHPHPGGGVA